MNYIYVFSLFLVVPILIGSSALDDLAIKYGTDKSSRFHGYTKIYEKYFSPIKDISLKFLEIGFWRGSSAHMWEEYFPNAQLYCIDINATPKQFLKDMKRTHFHCVDQEDPIALTNFIKQVGQDFDIIIDDGGHTMNQQITSFKILFPFLKRGGIYVIEDLHTSYSQFIPSYIQFNKNNQQTTVAFLQNLIPFLNASGAHTGCADFDKCNTDIKNQLSLYEKDIESIHFYSSLCFIFKR